MKVSPICKNYHKSHGVEATVRRMSRKNFNATETDTPTVDFWPLLVRAPYNCSAYRISHEPSIRVQHNSRVYNRRRRRRRRTRVCAGMRTPADERAPVMFVGGANCGARDVKYDRSYLSYGRLVLHAITICIGA